MNRPQPLPLWFHFTPAARALVGILAIALALAPFAPAQPISPYLVGNNLWFAQAGQAATSPASSVMTHAAQVGLKLIRIGGSTFDYAPPSHADLLTWVDRIRAIGAEPIIQVSQYASVETAAATVAALNHPDRIPVRYWSIGNEPWLQAGLTLSELEMATRIEAYFKPRAAAMKEADPTIKIFGVNNEDFRGGLYARLFGGSHNIAGLVPEKTYYYCDGITWHRYPRDLAPPADAAWQGLNDIRSRIEQCAALVASANASLGRSGDDALLWAIGEFNSRNGANVHTFSNGQMFAGVYGLAMRHGAHFASAWSLRESTDNPLGPTDFGFLLGQGNLPRPSYWHTQFVARHFTGRYAEGIPSIADAASPVLVYGAVDDTLDRVSVMLLNRGDTPINYTLHLNSTNRHATPGHQAINVDAGRPDSHSDTLNARSTQVLVFHRHTLTRIAYSAEDFAAATPRPPATTRSTRPLAALVDDFATAGGLAATPYWILQDINGGTSSLDSGSLELRAGPLANSTAAVAGPVSSEFNFFDHGFTLALRGFALTAEDASASATSFRLSLNSTSARAFRSPDSLTLRLTPAEARLGFKIDQPDVQPELRAGTAAAPDFLALVPLPGPVTEVHLSLDPHPAGSVDGLHTIRYTLRLDGAFGRLIRTGSFDTPRSAWGDSGDSALVLESRRDSGTDGSATAFVTTRLDAITRQPVVLDNFTASFTDQAWWSRVTSGTQSSATFTEGAAVLLARTAANASAQLNGPVAPEFNFFDRPLTLELRELDLATADLASGAAVFRLSLNSTTERSFVSPDALALRLTPDELQFGFKLDQTSVNAEQRSGLPGTSPLLTLSLPRPLNGLLLTLVPAPGAPPRRHARRLHSPPHRFRRRTRPRRLFPRRPHQLGRRRRLHPHARGPAQRLRLPRGQPAARRHRRRRPAPRARRPARRGPAFRRLAPARILRRRLGRCRLHQSLRGPRWRRGEQPPQIRARPSTPRSRRLRRAPRRHPPSRRRPRLCPPRAPRLRASLRRAKLDRPRRLEPRALRAPDAPARRDPRLGNRAHPRLPARRGGARLRAPPRHRTLAMSLALAPAWINDLDVDPPHARRLPVINPATEETWAEIPVSGPDTIDAAVRSARAALRDRAWSGLAPAARGRLLQRWAALVREHRSCLAALLSRENGKPLRFAADELETAARYFDYYGAYADKLDGRVPPVAQHLHVSIGYEPLGVVGHIVPWNYPADIFARGVAPSLAVGDTVVVKPAPETTFVTLELARLAATAGIPPGVVNVIPGDGPLTGAALAAHPGVDALAFCGSATGGRAVLHAAAERLAPVVSLELGGKSAGIILPDVEAGPAAAALARSFCYNTAQSCGAKSRLLAPAARRDEVTDAVRTCFAGLVIGAPDEPDAYLGPLISARQLERVLGYIEQGRREGGVLAAGGRRPARRGFFIEPTLFHGLGPRSALVTEEIFGPVLVLQTYETIEEAIALANDSAHGLTADIRTRDIGLAHRFARELEVGHVSINGGAGLGVDVPFGGVKQSGFGREGGLEGLRQYARLKTVAQRLA